MPIPGKVRGERVQPLAPFRSWPPGRRSSCFPAELYPPPGPLTLVGIHAPHASKSSPGSTWPTTSLPCATRQTFRNAPRQTFRNPQPSPARSRADREHARGSCRARPAAADGAAGRRQARRLAGSDALRCDSARVASKSRGSEHPDPPTASPRRSDPRPASLLRARASMPVASGVGTLGPISIADRAVRQAVAAGWVRFRLPGGSVSDCHRHRRTGVRAFGPDSA